MASVTTEKDPPFANRRAEYRYVSLRVAIVIAGHRPVTRRTEWCDSHSSARSQDKPSTRRWTENREIGFRVAIIVGRSRDIARGPERRRIEREIFGSQDEPFTGRRPPERYVRCRISRKVGGCQDICACAEGSGPDRSVNALLPPPLSVRGAV